MSKFKCKHDWEISRDYSETKGVERSSILHCKICKVNLTAQEAMGIELWRNTVGVQKWLSVGAFVIASASFVISFLK